MNLWSRIGAVFVRNYVSVKLTLLKSRLDRLASERARSLAKLESSKVALQKMTAVCEEKQNDMRFAIEHAESTQKKYDNELERIKAENQVHETTIDCLVASNSLLLKRYEADTAIQIRREVATRTAGEERD